MKSEKNVATIWLQWREEEAQIASFFFFFFLTETCFSNLKQVAKFDRMASCLIPAKVSNPQQRESQGRQEEDKTYLSFVTWKTKTQSQSTWNF